MSDTGDKSMPPTGDSGELDAFLADVLKDGPAALPMPIEFVPGDEPEPAAKEAAKDPEENRLRPATLDAFVGQDEQVARLRVALTAAKKREAPLPHVLVGGPPGLGKTTIAKIIGAEQGGRVIELSAASLKAGDLITIVTDLRENDVLFIDEIHRIKTRVAEEVLYPAMEDFKVNVVLGPEGDQRAVSLPIHRFTLVGATTQAGHLPKPLQDRFGLAFTFEFYKPDHLVEIITRSAGKLATEDNALGTAAKKLAPEAAKVIAGSSRGTPRIANRLLARVLDYVLAKDANEVTEAVARETLALEGIDGAGLNKLDRRYLRALMGPYQGGPAGLEALASMLQEDAETLRENVEPFLTYAGFILRTQQGRVATQYAAVLYGDPA